MDTETFTLLRETVRRFVDERLVHEQRIGTQCDIDRKDDERCGADAGHGFTC